MSALPPILRFLADADLERGPFGILGLSSDNCAEPAISEALRRQLERLARHPHGGTIEADEVRLALHVAAAQLRDPAVRSELIDELETLRRHPAPRSPEPLDKPALRSVSPAPTLPTLRAATAPPRITPSSFEFTTMWVIAHSGGWNAESQRRLWALAHASSINPSDLPAIVARVARRARQAPSDTSPHDPASNGARPHAPVRAIAAPLEETPLRKWGPLILIVALTTSSLIMLRAIAVIRRRETAPRTVLLTDPTQDTIQISSPPPLGAVPLTPDSWATTDDAAGPFANDPPTPPTPPTSPAPEAPPASPTAPVPSVPLDPAVELWVTSAKRAIASTIARPTPEERLARALRFAIANSAAEKQWQGDSDEARRLIEAADSYSPPFARSTISREEQDNLLFRLTAPATGEDGRVARYFQLARRQPGSSLEALSRLRFRQEPLGPADCDVIAEVALFGPSAELRDLARRFVDDQANNPIMLYSLLESVHQAPKTRSSADLIERATLRTLPSLTTPDWPRAARAAILARLLEMLSVERIPTVDELAQRLSFAYTTSLGNSPPHDLNPHDPNPLNPNPPAENTGQWQIPDTDPTSPLSPGTHESPPDPLAASRLLELWRSRCEIFHASPELTARLRSILHRREARLALASGPVQRFLAEQSTIVDLAALAVAAERPTRAHEARAIAAAATEQRRNARHAFEQIESNERALTRLWIIRFGAPIQALGDGS